MKGAFSDPQVVYYVMLTTTASKVNELAQPAALPMMEKSRAPTPLEKEGPNSDNREMRQQQKAREFRERAERENDRMVDIRDTKRLKSDHGESVLAPIPFDRLK